MINIIVVESAISSFARADSIFKHAELMGKLDKYTQMLREMIYNARNINSFNDIGLLWNAYYEKPGAYICNELSDSENPLLIQADSGGLQMVTLQLEMTPEEESKIKDDIYRFQAKYSTEAISFDKMPLLLDERALEENEFNQGLKLVNNVKYFVKELLEESGRISGENIKRQIDIFIEENTECKVLPVIHGWGIDDYNLYAKGLYSVFYDMEEIERKKYFKYISGISIGNSLFSPYFEMFDVYLRAPIDLIEVPEEHRNRIHVLGLSGASRTGILYALQQDFFGKDVTYSFDGTSRTSSTVYGRYTTEKSSMQSNITTTISLGKNLDSNMKLFGSELQATFGDTLSKYLLEDITSIDLDEFILRFIPWNIEGMKKIEISKNPTIEERELYINKFGLGSFMHWILELRSYLHQTEKFKQGDYSNITDNQYREAMSTLHNICSHEEYMKKREWFKLKLKDKRNPRMTYVKSVKEFNELINNKYCINDWM